MNSSNNIVAEQSDLSWTKSQVISKDDESVVPAVISETTYSHDGGRCHLTIQTMRNRKDAIPHEVLIHYIDQDSESIHELSKLQLPSVIKTESNSIVFALSPLAISSDIQDFNTIMEVFLRHHHLKGTRMFSDIRASCFMDGNSLANETVVHLINNNPTLYAVKYVIDCRKKPDFELMWFLTRCLHEEFIMGQQLDLESIYYLFGHLSEDNPYYESIKEKLQDMVKLSELEQKFLKAYYRYDHDLSNKYYNQMCGYPENSQYFKLYIDQENIVDLLKNVKIILKQPKPKSQEDKKISEPSVMNDQPQKKKSKYHLHLNLWHKKPDHKIMTTDHQESSIYKNGR